MIRKNSTAVEIRVGDRVWLLVPAIGTGKSKKLSSLWHGPYTVIDKTGPVNYRIQLIGRTHTTVVHHNRLKLCFGDPQRAKSKPSQWRTTPQQSQQNHRCMSQSYRDALLKQDTTGGYVTSDTIQNSCSNPPTSSRPICSRHPPDRYGVYVQH